MIRIRVVGRTLGINLVELLQEEYSYESSSPTNTSWDEHNRWHVVMHLLPLNNLTFPFFKCTVFFLTVLPYRITPLCFPPNSVFTCDSRPSKLLYY